MTESGIKGGLTTKQLEIMNGLRKLPGNGNNISLFLQTSVNKWCVFKRHALIFQIMYLNIHLKDTFHVFTLFPDWSWYRLAIVALGLVALIAAVVVVSIWIRAGGIYSHINRKVDKPGFCLWKLKLTENMVSLFIRMKQIILDFFLHLCHENNKTARHISTRQIINRKLSWNVCNKTTFPNITNMSDYTEILELTVLIMNSSG